MHQDKDDNMMMVMIVLPTYLPTYQPTYRLTPYSIFMHVCNVSSQTRYGWNM